MATYGYKLVKTLVLKALWSVLSHVSRTTIRCKLNLYITIILSLVVAMLTRLENSAKGTIIDDTYAKEEWCVIIPGPQLG